MKQYNSLQLFIAVEFILMGTNWGFYMSRINANKIRAHLQSSTCPFKPLFTAHSDPQDMNRQKLMP